MSQETSGPAGRQEGPGVLAPGPLRADVVVLDKAAVGATTTARSIGKLSVLQGVQFARIAHHGDEAVGSHLAAGFAGLGWLRGALEDLGVPVENRHDLTITTTPARAPG